MYAEALIIWLLILVTVMVVMNGVLIGIIMYNLISERSKTNE